MVNGLTTEGCLGRKIHTPVLVDEVIKGLKVKKGGRYIDATFGEGGDTERIIQAGGRVLAIDWDKDQLAIVRKRFQKIKGLTIVEGNFIHLDQIGKRYGFVPVEGILFDLGLSLRQIKKSGRGFSYQRREEPLDMRISSRVKDKAEDLINSLSEKELYEILARYSEEVYSRSISRAIVRSRSLKKIRLVGDLIRVIDKGTKLKNSQLRKRVYQRVFQAFRIAVNKELVNLEKGLERSLKIVKKNGRIVVLSFHSLEDRVVKKFIGRHRQQLVEITKKVMKKGEGEIFERSARLRVIAVKSR